MRIDDGGMLVGAEFIPSPNCDDRPATASPELLVIHAISLPPNEFGGDGVMRLFTNTLDCSTHPFYQTLQGVRVSAHFFIRRNGKVIQFVPCGLRAWHAGLSCWQERERCNDFSLGVELEGGDTQPFTSAQYVSLISLTQALRQVYPFIAIAGHADIAPLRKTDPGPFFDWGHYLSGLCRT